MKIESENEKYANSSLRESFLIFAILEILISHHHSASFSRSATAIVLEVQHCLTQQINDSQLTLKRESELTVDIVMQLNATYRIIKLALALLNEQYHMLVGSLLHILVGCVSHTEKVTVE